MIAFIIKLPLWPLHVWLPTAHGEAPSAVSIWLAGILLKVAGYGILRIVLPFFPSASQAHAEIIQIMSVISIIYGGLMAIKQTDLKWWVAYSSIAHMGFVGLGIFSLTALGMQGAVVQMVSHGLVSAGLFAAIGVLYDRFHTRLLAHYHGLSTIMPICSTFLFIFGMGILALPGTGSFIGEIFILMGSMPKNIIGGGIASLGIILSSLYVLVPYQHLIFGPARPHFTGADLTRREWGMLLPLALGLFFLGLAPYLLLQFITPPLHHILKGLH